VNKRASLTVKAVPTGNYPDVLGAITAGEHLNIDVLQVAIAARPSTVGAGKALDALVVLQNASNIDVDAVIRLSVPESDLAGNKGRFTTTLTKPIRIGLRPAEVGVANLPLLCSQQTMPGDNYQIQLELQVEQKQRGPARVRDLNGGTVLHLEDLPEERQQGIAALRGLRYSTSTIGRVSGNRATITAPFEVLPPVIAELRQDLKPGYSTLWTIADYPDEGMIVDKVKDLTAAILPSLTRNNIFIPTLKTTQEHFEAAGFRLWAGEGIAIAKLLTLVLEMGVLPADKGATLPIYPRWYIKLCRLLIQNPQSAAHLESLIAENLYSELIHDAVTLGFSMLTTVTKQEFGSAEEMTDYAKQLVASLSGRGEAIDFTHAYLPLVLAGIIANGRVSMPQEQIRDTASLMATARDNRAGMIDDSNKFLFDMADDLITRALEHF
jgi:hypothetical protein